jgi:hypothetical protein
MEDLSQPVSHSPSKQRKAEEEAKLKALKAFAVDTHSLAKLHSRLDQAFENDDRLLRAIETLV